MVEIKGITEMEYVGSSMHNLKIYDDSAVENYNKFFWTIAIV